MVRVRATALLGAMGNLPDADWPVLHSLVLRSAPFLIFRSISRTTTHSKLSHIVQEPDLLTRLESRQANVRTSIAPERITERAVPARPRLALDSKIQFIEVVGIELEGAKVSIGLGTAGFVFVLELLGEAAGAVLAGAATLAGLGLTLGS
jgi:hypothetical protein